VKRTYMSPRVAAPVVVAPLYSAAVSAATWTANNEAVFMRCALPVATPLRYLNWICSVQSGNVQVGVVSLSGANRTSFTRVMDSGVIACPAAANIRTDLGLTTLPAGDYAMFMWADNTTFQTPKSTASSLPSLRWCGVATISGGVGTTGTLTWSNRLVNLSLEGDV